MIEAFMELFGLFFVAGLVGAAILFAISWLEDLYLGWQAEKELLDFNKVAAVGSRNPDVDDSSNGERKRALADLAAYDREIGICAVAQCAPEEFEGDPDSEDYWITGAQNAIAASAGVVGQGVMGGDSTTLVSGPSEGILNEVAKGNLQPSLELRNEVAPNFRYEIALSVVESTFYVDYSPSSDCSGANSINSTSFDGGGSQSDGGNDNEIWF